MSSDFPRPGAASAALDALDALSAAPDHHHVLMENEFVRVLDTRVGPGRCTPVHTHEWPAALYVMSWSNFIRYDAEDKLLLDSRQMASRPAVGTALWGTPLAPHRVRNVGDAELRVIAVELKRTLA